MTISVLPHVLTLSRLDMFRSIAFRKNECLNYEVLHKSSGAISMEYLQSTAKIRIDLDDIMVASLNLDDAEGSSILQVHFMSTGIGTHTHNYFMMLEHG